MSQTIGKILGIAAMALVLVTGVGTAKADIVSTAFQLNVDNCSTLCMPALTSGGTVTLTQFTSGANTGDVGFDILLTSPLSFHDTTAFDTFAFNYTGTGTLSIVAGTETAGFTSLIAGSSSTRKEDGACSPASTQCYSYVVDYNGAPVTGGVTGITELKFVVSSSSGPVTLAMFENTGSGVPNTDFAAAVTTSGFTTNCTGVIGGGNGTAQSTASPSSGTSCGGGNNTVTPEPVTSSLIGTGLIGLFFLGRRRIARKA
jgi:hypothetical protein